MRIQLKQLRLTNFKGIRDLTIVFKDKTDILGANATGKTTIFDAFSWLLFDKDSLSRKEFGIKTYQPDGDTLHGVDHTVAGILDIDGEELRLIKTYSEKWTKKRGSPEATFSGHTTSYWIQDVPVKQKEYQERIESIIPEETFKLLSNPLYFNEILDFRKRREVLLSLVDEVTQEDVFQANESLEPLRAFAIPVAEVQKMQKAQAAKLNKELQEFPIRIDELTKTKVDANIEGLKEQQEQLTAKRNAVNDRLLDAAEAMKVNDEKYARISSLKMNLRAMEYEREQKNRDNQRKTDDDRHLVRSRLERSEQEIQSLRNDRARMIVELDKLRTEYRDTAEKEIESDTHCQYCKQALPEDQLESLRKEIQMNKSNRLEEIIAEGEMKSKALEDVDHRIKSVADQIEGMAKELENIADVDLTEVQLPKEYTEMREELEQLETELVQPPADVDTWKAERARLDTQLREIEGKLFHQEQNEKTDKKIQEHKDKAKETAKLYEKAQQILILCEEYTKTHVDLVTEKLNASFGLVRFKLFEQQINGGIAETCEALINGVPYADANHAAQINAGIDVINTLSKHYGITTPIFVDNAEAVNVLEKTDSQLIRLVVSDDKELVIL